MISLPNFYAMQAALSRPLEPSMHRLLSCRVADIMACGLAGLSHILVIEPGDGEEDFLHAAAFSPFRNPLSDSRYGDPDFYPHWDWAGRTDGIFEWFTTVGNAGFAFIVIVPETDDINPALLSMLRKHVPRD